MLNLESIPSEAGAQRRQLTTDLATISIFADLRYYNFDDTTRLLYESSSVGNPQGLTRGYLS